MQSLGCGSIFSARALAIFFGIKYVIPMRVLPILILAVLALSCSKTAPLEGTWHEAYGDRTLVFVNTVVTASNGQHTILAQYEVIDESTMFWGRPPAISPIQITYKLDGNTLVLVQADEEVVYRRK